MAKHAILSPSGAEKWVNCAGSARMEQIFKKEETPSRYAAEGTAAHFLASEILSGKALIDCGAVIEVTNKGNCFFYSAEQEIGRAHV